MRIRVLGVVASALAATLLTAQLTGSESAEAAAATTTTVVRGTAFPDPLTAQLSFAGCATMSGLTAETPQPTIGAGTVKPPTGTRSLGFDLVGGNAVGALFMRPSMTATAVADLQVSAAAGSTGVAYAGYQEPADAGTNRVWVGRADVLAAGTGWQRISATGLSYAWTKYDLVTGAVAQPGLAAVYDVRSFVASHGGDGPGFYSIGLGCDGRPFSLDTFRVGVAGSTQVYDLEGLATTTTIGGRSHAVLAGDAATLTGTVRDQSGAPVPDATLILEQRTSAAGSWTTVFRDEERTDPVVVDASGAGASVEVTPARTTSYRFRFADRPLAEGSASAPFVVTVTPVLTARVTAGRVVSGTLSPADAGATVALWRSGRAPGSALARAVVDAEGRYEIAVPPEVGGELVVRFAGTPALQPATSGPVRVEALVTAPPTTPTTTPSATPTQTPSPAGASTPAQPDRQEQPAEQQEQQEQQPSQGQSQAPAGTPAEPESPAQEPAATETTTAAP